MLPFYPFRGRKRRQCFIFSAATACGLLTLFFYLKGPPGTVQYTEVEEHKSMQVSRAVSSPDTYPVTHVQSSTPASSSSSSPSNTTRFKFKMVVGVLTTLRHPPTVLDVARRLVHVTNASDYKFLAWQSHSASGDARTRHELEQLGFEVSTRHQPYPELEPDRIRITWNDSLERMKWRTNHGKTGYVELHTRMLHTNVVARTLCYVYCSLGLRVCTCTYCHVYMMV